MRKTLYKAAALSVCLGLLLLAVPDLNAAPKKVTKGNFFTKTVTFISSVLPMKSIFTIGKLKKLKKTVKATGTLSADRVSDRD